jgi:tyrosyl-tRNA synthetase
MLHSNYGCLLQFGGSDQWGNITNGCDLIKKLSKSDIEGYGITMPLLLTKTG